jgi:hypothetical protein
VRECWDGDARLAWSMPMTVMWRPRTIGASGRADYAGYGSDSSHQTTIDGIEVTI